MKRIASGQPHSVALLVVSCDKYSDLWPGFFACLRERWPDRPYPVYLTANTCRPAFTDVTPILVGPDTSWSDSLSRALLEVPEDYILMMLEDLYLTAPVLTAEIKLSIDAAIAGGADYVSLNPYIVPTGARNGVLRKLRPGTLYRVSTVCSLWKKATLASLLRAGESAWDFEIYGSERSDQYTEFYGVTDGHIHTANVVVKGKWTRRGARLARRRGTSADSLIRTQMSTLETAELAAIRLRAWLLRCLPEHTQRAIRGLFQVTHAKPELTDGRQ